MAGWRRFDEKSINYYCHFVHWFALYGQRQRSVIYAPDGIALKGYDVVAFFTQGKPVKGSLKGKE